MNAVQESPQNVLTARARLGEGPCWHPRKQLLYWVDIYNHRVHEFNSTTGEQNFFDVGEVVGCIAPAGTNRFIMALRHRLAFLDTSNGEVTPIIDVEENQPSDIRLNDGKCDAAGRFWFGSMSTSGATARLFRYDPDGSLHVLLTGLTGSNGLGWSPDQSTFYLTDSPLKKIYAFDFDLDSGNISNQRVFAEINIDGVPDGLAVDRDGCIWSAIWDGWCIVKFDPTGKEIARISMPVQRPTCCVFGNQDLATLYITSASVGLSEKEIQESFYSGDLFSLATNTSGMPTYEFAG